MYRLFGQTHSYVRQVSSTTYGFLLLGMRHAPNLFCLCKHLGSVFGGTELSKKRFDESCAPKEPQINRNEDLPLGIGQLRQL